MKENIIFGAILIASRRKDQVPYINVKPIAASINPLKTNDVITAININTNLHLKIPPSVPSVLNTEYGPTCKNLVIPMDPVKIETE